MYYTLVNYFDVWGDKTNGYEINNQSVEFTDWYIAENATKKDILRYLKVNRYINTDDMRKVNIDDYGDYMEVYAVKNHYPLYGIIENYK